MSADVLEDDEESDVKEQKKKHEDFLLAEYGSIAQAYFNTTSTIATFFRNYLVVVGLPVPVLGYVLTQGSKATGGAPGNISPPPPEFSWVVLLVAWLIAGLGLSLMLYVVNLRLDALLYARTVNGIRKYFYDKSPLGYPQELQMRVLPRTVTQPRYHEWPYFLPVIIVFAILNTLYPIGGLAWHASQTNPDRSDLWGQMCFWGSLFCTGLFLAAHFVGYWWLARYRQTAYLRKLVIGVDIDGVLNTHRDTFCTKVHQLLGKSIWADQITAVPVRNVPHLGITEADEAAVFNLPEYWQELRPMDGASNTLRKLKNTFGFRVVVFTHRPWPEPKQIPTVDRERFRSLWRQAVQWWSGADRSLASVCNRLWHAANMPLGRLIGSVAALWRPFSHHSISVLTRRWLAQHHFIYDKLVVERGNAHTAGPNQAERNRFAMAERDEIRIFVEDDLFKAMKLANTCEIVFLIDQPYNQHTLLPRNVIRVRTWNEIYEYVRQQL